MIGLADTLVIALRLKATKNAKYFILDSLIILPSFQKGMGINREKQKGHWFLRFANIRIVRRRMAIIKPTG